MKPLWLLFPGGKIVSEKDNKRPMSEALYWAREGDEQWTRMEERKP